MIGTSDGKQFNSEFESTAHELGIDLGKVSTSIIEGKQAEDIRLPTQERIDGAFEDIKKGIQDGTVDPQGQNAIKLSENQYPWNKSFPDEPKPVMPPFGENRGLPLEPPVKPKPGQPIKASDEQPDPVKAGQQYAMELRRPPLEGPGRAGAGGTGGSGPILRRTASDDINTHAFSFKNETGRGHISITERKSGRDLYVNHTGSYGGPNSLGKSDVRSILRQLKEEFPAAERIGGFRVSGARAEAGKIGDAWIRIRKPSEVDPMAQRPLPNDYAIPDTPLRTRHSPQSIDRYIQEATPNFGLTNTRPSVSPLKELGKGMKEGALIGGTILGAGAAGAGGSLAIDAVNDLADEISRRLEGTK